MEVVGRGHGDDQRRARGRGAARVGRPQPARTGIVLIGLGLVCFSILSKVRAARAGVAPRCSRWPTASRSSRSGPRSPACSPRRSSSRARSGTPGCFVRRARHGRPRRRVLHAVLDRVDPRGGHVEVVLRGDAPARLAGPWAARTHAVRQGVRVDETAGTLPAAADDAPPGPVAPRVAVRRRRPRVRVGRADVRDPRPPAGVPAARRRDRPGLGRRPGPGTGPADHRRRHGHRQHDPAGCGPVRRQHAALHARPRAGGRDPVRPVPARPGRRRHPVPVAHRTALDPHAVGLPHRRADRRVPAAALLLPARPVRTATGRR